MSIPEELKTTPRWVCCTADKLPICPRNGAAASSTDPGTWADYATAAGAVSRLGCRGIGFVLGDGIAGIDIDHCIDPSTGGVDETALAIVDAMHSYTEISPSGTGLHILWRGVKAGPACRRSLAPGMGLEMYDGGRYFTVTGRSWHNPPLPLAERTAEAAEIYHQYLEKQKPAVPTAAQAIPVQPRPAGAPSDSEILEKAKQAKGGEKLAALLAGDWQPYAPSRSEADLALCNLLAFWLGADKARMDDGRGVVSGVLALEERFRHAGLAQIAVHIAAAHAFIDGFGKIPADDVHVLPHIGKDDGQSCILTNGHHLVGGDIRILRELAEDVPAHRRGLALPAFGKGGAHVGRQTAAGVHAQFGHRGADVLDVNFLHDPDLVPFRYTFFPSKTRD